MTTFGPGTIFKIGNMHRASPQKIPGFWNLLLQLTCRYCKMKRWDFERLSLKHSGHFVHALLWLQIRRRKRLRLYTVSQKRDPDIFNCNFMQDWRILTIFGTNIPDTTGHQMALPVPTSPDVCFCTTWGKQNKRNMHWHEQQTSTNWRLDRIKIWSRQSELLRYIIYLLTAVFPAIKCVAGDTFVFQQDSAPAHQLAKRSNCWSAKPTSSLRICGPKWPWPQSGWLEALGSHATADLSDDVQECGWT